MRQLLCIIFLFGLISFAHGQSAITSTEGCAPLKVRFSSPSTTHHWEFGGSAGSSSGKLEHEALYGSAGSFTATMYTDGTLSTKVAEVEVTVYDTPTLALSANLSNGCAPLDIEFTPTVGVASGLSISSVDWVFGDGTIGAGNTIQSHTYTGGGNYNVSLELTTNIASCNTQQVFSSIIEVYDLPEIGFEMDPDPTSACAAPLTVSFANMTADPLAPVDYLWDFGDGTTSNAENPPNKTYTADGTYKVTLTATNSRICSISTSQEVNIGSTGGVISVSDNLCKDVGVVFEYYGANRVEWQFGTDAEYYNSESSADWKYEPITSSREKRIEIFYRSAGSRTVSLETNNGGCVNTVTKDVFVQEIIPTVQSTPVQSCINPVDVIHKVLVPDASDPIYNWYEFYDGSSSSNQSETVNYFDDGNAQGGIGTFNEFIDSTYIIPVIVTDGITACYDTAFTEFRHAPLNAKMAMKTEDPSGCAPNLVLEFRNAANDNNDPLQPPPPAITKSTWDFGDGNQIVLTGANAEDDVSNTYASEGDYDVVLTIENASGCSSTSYPLKVSVGPDVETLLDFTTNNATPCIGEEIELTPDFSAVIAAGHTIERWHFYTEGKRSFNLPNDNPVKWTYHHEAGLQDVSLEVEINGCLSMKTEVDFIDVQGAAAAISYTRDCARPYVIDFENYDPTSLNPSSITYTWDFGDGDIQALGTSSAHTKTYASQGTYTVYLTADDPGSGCVAKVDSADILIVEPVADLFIDPAISVCSSGEVTLDASGSSGASCRGYTYSFEGIDLPATGVIDYPDSIWARPITWDRDSAVITLPETPAANVGNGNPPTYSISLTITDKIGCSRTVQESITPGAIDVDGMATLDGTNPMTEVCIPQEFELQDMVSSDNAIVSWVWGFSSGDTLKAQNKLDFSLVNSPPDDGNYYATLEVEDINGCTGGVGDTIIVLDYYSLRSRITTSEDAICTGDMVSFEARDDTRHGSNLDFSWTFNNAAGDLGSNQTEDISYVAEGNYNTRLIFTEQSTGCYDSLFKTIYVQESPSAGFTTSVDAEPFLCYPQTIIFTDVSTSTSGIASVYWDTGDGNNSDLSVYAHSYDQKGNYTASLKVGTSNGCETTIDRVFDIGGPEGTIDANDHILCEDQEVTFTLENDADVNSFEWNFGDGNISDQSPASHTYQNIPASRTITVQLLLSDNVDINELDACRVVVPLDVSFQELTADYSINDGTDFVICLQENLPFTFRDISTNADTYSWDFGDGSASTEANPSHQYLETGTFAVRLAVENTTEGCMDTVYYNIESAATPITQIMASADSLCLGDELTLEVIDAEATSNYTWTPSEVVSSGGSHPPSFTPNETFTAIVTEVDNNGCRATAEKAIVVLSPYEFENWKTTIKLGESATLPVVYDPNYIFSLTPTDDLSCADCDNPQVSPEFDTIYELQVSDELGCLEDTYELSVIVIPPAFISMPEAFTPNGDGMNDVAYFGGKNISELLEYQMFNRWGELLFTTTQMNEGWDGTFRGQLQNAGVYIYKIRALANDGEIVLREGYLNLIR